MRTILALCTGWTGLPGVPTCTMFRGIAVPRAVLPSSATKDIPGKVDSTRGFLGEMPTVMRGAGGSQNNWGAGWGAGGRTGRVANGGMEATGFTVMFCPSEVAVKIKETVDEGERGTGGGPPGPGSQWQSGEVMGRGLHCLQMFPREFPAGFIELSTVPAGIFLPFSKIP